jgi:RimJ/RimL family protein N-acetyltransferase
MILGNLVGLRAVEKEDLELLKNWRNNSDFRKNFREVRELSITDQELWLDSLNRTKHINFMFVIVRLEDNKPIGAGGLLYINWINRAADFSFYIGENSLYVDDNGYSLEATRLLIEYGFNNLNLNKIWMELYEFDLKKLEFFKQKFNFIEDGTLRDNCYENGKYYDSYIISILKKDYLPTLP